MAARSKELVKLTEHDQEKYRKDREHAAGRIGVLTIRKVRFNEIVKALLKKQEDAYAQAQHILREDEHYIEVELHFDYDRKRVLFYHPDTGARVGSRPMNAKELQISMDLSPTDQPPREPEPEVPTPIKTEAAMVEAMDVLYGQSAGTNPAEDAPTELDKLIAEQAADAAPPPKKRGRKRS